MQEVADKTIKLESMRTMPIDQIIALYNDGYVIENVWAETPYTAHRQIKFGLMDNIHPPDPAEVNRHIGNREGYIIEASQLPEIPISESQRRYGFSEGEALPFEHTPPEAYERERKYGFAGNISVPPTIPPAIQERWERQIRYGSIGQVQSLQGVSISSGIILLIGIGALAYLYLRKK